LFGPGVKARITHPPKPAGVNTHPEMSLEPARGGSVAQGSSPSPDQSPTFSPTANDSRQRCTAKQRVTSLRARLQALRARHGACLMGIFRPNHSLQKAHGKAARKRRDTLTDQRRLVITRLGRRVEGLAWIKRQVECNCRPDVPVAALAVCPCSLGKRGEAPFLSNCPAYRFRRQHVREFPACSHWRSGHANAESPMTRGCCPVEGHVCRKGQAGN
jgi:hypothetical protein